MLSRPHPALGWLYISPADTRRVMNRLLRDRDAAVEADPNDTGMPKAFLRWTWETWLPSHINRYAKQVEEHVRYLDLKIGNLNQSLEHLAGGVLDDRDAAADLRDRLQRELDARETS